MAFTLGDFLLFVSDGEQRCSNRAHKPRVRSARDGATNVRLECSKHGVVGERAALNDDALTEAVEVRHADDLGENVLDDGTAKACHDVVGRFAVLLLGDDR